MLKTKIIHNVDDDIWRQFTGYCKMQNVLTGHKLSIIMAEHLEREKRYVS